MTDDLRFAYDGPEGAPFRLPPHVDAQVHGSPTLPAPQADAVLREAFAEPFGTPSTLCPWQPCVWGAF